MNPTEPEPDCDRLTALLAERDAALARAEVAEDALRSLASWLGAGGYNSEAVSPETYEQKIRWGIDAISQPLQARVRELEALVNTEAEKIADMSEKLSRCAERKGESNEAR